MHIPKSFARFLSLPENRLAHAAVRELAREFSDRASGAQPGSPQPLVLHGPTGTGKTHLAAALVREVTRRSYATVAQLSGADFDVAEDRHDLLRQALSSDLTVVEDLQLLPERGEEPVVQLLEQRLAERKATVLTTRLGPQKLAERFAARLTSRLAGGLVVALEPLQPVSRLALLCDFAQRRQLAVPTEALRWLADNISGGGRVLHGCLNRLDALLRLHGTPPDAATLSRHFGEQARAGRPTLERIAQQVGGYFRVETKALQSRRRHHNILWPRQVGMYLARRLTGLSLDQIGAYFGGRDHATVLHACRKVDQALARGDVRSGAICQLRAELC